MPREAEPSQNEREFLQQALREDVRLDGRALDAYRDVQVSFGEDYGVTDVRLGKTRYILSSYIIFCFTQPANQISLQRPRQNLRHPSNPLPRPQVRRHLHHHRRALPPRLPRLRKRPVSHTYSSLPFRCRSKPPPPPPLTPRLSSTASTSLPLPLPGTCTLLTLSPGPQISNPT